MERPPMPRTPLFRAPRGMVWCYEGRGDVAHLLQSENDPRNYLNLAVCGAEFKRQVMSFRVGGYSAPPCLECIARQWEAANAP